MNKMGLRVDPDFFFTALLRKAAKRVLFLMAVPLRIFFFLRQSSIKLEVKVKALMELPLKI